MRSPAARQRERAVARYGRATAKATARTAVAALLAATGAGAGCAPTIGRDPLPEAMQFDPQSTPPRAPQPIGLIVNAATDKIDFSLANITVAADCTKSTALSEAECEFDQYLQTLDGFPTTTPAAAPASAPLDLASLTAANVVVLDQATGAPVPATLGFDAVNVQLTVKPIPSWDIGRTYWIGVRGYANGVRAADGNTVVGSPTQFLLKQDTSLTCGATTAADVPATCPAEHLLAQSMPAAAAAASLLQLEAIRQTYVAGNAFAIMTAAGLPKAEVAVLWSFPTHTASVAELDPTSGLVPVVAAPNEIHVAVKGTVNPTTVSAFVVKQQPGSIVVMDLTAAAAADLVAGFPAVTATYAAGNIVITGSAPFITGHQYGLFFTNAILNAQQVKLVPSPVSVLLSLPGKLVDATTGKSAISTVADSDAAMLEAGRAQLATLFDNPVFAALTGLTRDKLVYCYAFAFGAQP